MSKNTIDLTGRVFSRLTVLEFAEKRASGKRYWRCRCECGALTVVRGSALTSGKSGSCGCWAPDRARPLREDLTGRTFGRLTVIDFAFTRTGQGAFWNCRCGCGTLRAFNGSSMRLGTSLSCGCLQRDVARSIARRNVKITPDQALEIRREYATGQLTQKQLGAKYDVQQTTISAILRGDKYSDAGGPLSKTERPLTPNIVRAIREDYRKVGAFRPLAKKYDVSDATITLVVRRKTWKHVSDLDPKTVEQYQASLLKPINPDRKLKNADALSIFGVHSDDTEPSGGEGVL